MRLSLLLPALLISALHDAAGQNSSGDHPRCGTMLVADALHHPERLDEKDHRTVTGMMAVRPTTQQSTTSRNGHFTIHYDVSGGDAVAATDNNANGRPDYIDSTDFYMEYAWQLEIEQLGYAPPPPDNGGPTNGVDVYIQNLGAQGVYGFAFPETVGNNKATGYLVLDNDYVEGIFTSRGIAGLRVTSAHEFHHLIQFGSYRYDLTQATVYEATSTWMERVAHPPVPDYEQYVDMLFSAPQLYGMSTHKVNDAVTGYAHQQYLVYIAKKLGDDVVREFWEEFGTEPNCWRALDAALVRRGLNLERSSYEFSEWCYFSGRRAIDDTTYFRGADTLPPLRAVSFTPWPAGADELEISGMLYPLGFGLWQAGLPNSSGLPRDTVTFLVTNDRTDLPIGGSTVVKEPFTITLRRNGSGSDRPIRGPGDTITYSVNNQGGRFYVAVYLGTLGAVFPAPRITPQPFLNDGVGRLLFDISDAVSGELNDSTISSISLALYTTAMTPVARIERTAPDVERDMVGIVWDGRDRDGRIAPSGVYIYELTVNGGTPRLGKIMVIRR